MRPVGDFNDVAAAGVDHDGVAVDALGSEIMDVALMDVSVQEIARMMVIHHADERLEAVVRDVLSVADAEISTLEKKLACLRDEKKALMQQLLTGKRRVKVDEAVAE